MYADISQPPAPLPAVHHSAVRPGISLLRPLSRRGFGPGLILLTTASSTDESVTVTERAPSPLMKWAEEGYTVVQIAPSALDGSSMADALADATKAFEGCDQCQPKDKVGLVAYSAPLWNAAAAVLDTVPSVAASVVFLDEADLDGIATASSSSSSSPSSHVLRHVAGKAGKPPGGITTSPLVEYRYPAAQSRRFAAPSHAHFHYNTESVAHTRTLQFLKPRMGGPYFDLEAIWEEHTYYEFADRSVEHTMSTMVQEPYVNHVPTMTGGVGRDRLTNFYRHNFIFNNSADTELELISRTVGIDRVIDEFIFKFTHDRELDWLLPGVPPTHRKAEVPFNAVVNVRGDRLYHEHIAWDQGTTLRQLGLLPEYLPFPYPLPEGQGVAKGAAVEYRVPVAGLETASKMRDRNSVLSNEMFKFSVREVPK